MYFVHPLSDVIIYFYSLTLSCGNIADNLCQTALSEMNMTETIESMCCATVCALWLTQYSVAPLPLTIN